MESHPPTRPEDEPLPRGMMCPACAYDLSGAVVHRCSECGRAIQARDVFAFRARMGAGEASVRLARIQALGTVGVAALTSAGFAVLVGDWWSGLIAGMVVLLMLGAPWGAGWCAAMLSPRPSRAAWRLAWLRSIAWLHVSWVSMLVLAGGATVLARMASRGLRRGEGGAGLVVGGLLLLFLVWIGVSIFGFASGEERWQRECDAMGLWERWPRRVYTVLLGLTITGSILLGLAFGVFLAGGGLGIR